MEKMTFKEARQKRGLTQREVDFRCSFSQARMSLIENNKYAPSDEEKARLASVLEMRAEDIKWPTLIEE